MKSTFLWLSAAALSVTSLIFVLHMQKPPVRVLERAPKPAGLLHSESATDGGVVVSNSTELDVPDTLVSTEQPEVALRQKPVFDGTAWQAGIRFYEAGDFESAVEALEWAVEEGAEDAYRHYLLALAYRKAGLPDAAVEEFSLSLELEPAQPKAWLNLARAQLELDLVEEARVSVDEALGLQLDDAHAWNVLGQVELRESKLDEAAAAFAKATDRDPEFGYAWNNLGYVRILQGRFQEALEPLQRATADEAAEGFFFNNLAFVCEQLDDLAGSLQAFARAEELGHPGAGGHGERIGALLAARGDEFGADGPVHASLSAEK